MKIALLGYMGSGKSTLGKTLAKRLNYSFIELDERVEEAMGMSISTAIEIKGELFFRKCENAVLKELLATVPDSVVLSLGGGTPAYYNHMDLLNEHMLTVYLDVPVQTLVQRLQASHPRPLLQGIDDVEEYIAKHLFDRMPFYYRAQKVLKGSEISVEDVVNAIG